MIYIYATKLCYVLKVGKKTVKQSCFGFKVDKFAIKGNNLVG